MKKYVATMGGLSYDGTTKPREDVSKILSNNGFIKFNVDMFGELSKETRNLLYKTLNKGDLFVFQSPLYDANQTAEKDYLKIFNEIGVKSIALIHDVDPIRFGGDLKDYVEKINKYSGLIIASQKLADILQPSVPYVIQGPWDYLAPNNHKNHYQSEPIVYAGNLTKPKTSFLDDIKYPINVYGDPYDRKINGFKGRYKPEELPGIITGSYGLVWDSNKYGDYQTYNWSYKLSLYIVSGLPIIARSGSNVGDFVLKNNIGFVIDNVLDIDKSNKPYYDYINNIKDISDNMLNGFYILNAIKNIEREIL